MKFDFEIVGKIGSMALIRKDEGDIDYNIFSRIGAALRPGIIWVSSGATEIGRLDFIRRNGRELLGDIEEVKTDYSSQGQAILMENYRRFISPQYSVRQVLLELNHLNDPERREHIRRFLMRCAVQGAIPIVNYNDPVSTEENRHVELANYRNAHGYAAECIDNDETAAVICTLMKSRYLVLLTSVDGIYGDPDDPSTLIREVHGKDAGEVVAMMREMQKSCLGVSRKGANGARAKLEFAIEPVRQGTTVIIANAKYSLNDVIVGGCPRTIIGVK